VYLESLIIIKKSGTSISEYFAQKMQSAGTLIVNGASAMFLLTQPCVVLAAKPVSRFQVAGGLGFSEDVQARYYENMSHIAITGRGG